jgi:hypothetical protein
MLMAITLSAANNLLVEYDSERWALLTSGFAEPALIATSAGVQFTVAFATARRLDPGGLRPDQVTMVVSGWSAEDSSWHVGLLLDPALAEARGGRWCELLRWTTVSGVEAEQAGRKLAQVIGRPFRLVLPEPVLDVDAAADEAVEAAKRDVPLQPLPLHFGEWSVSEVMGGAEWERTPRWRRDQVMRGGFFALLTPVFGLLSLGALLSPYASVQPEWLPWIGLLLSVVMLYSAISSLAMIWRSPTTTVDRRVSMIRQTRRGSQKMVQAPFEGLEYVLVTHSPVRKQVADVARLVAVMEVWVHLYSPRRGFILVCSSENVEGYLARGIDFTHRRPLDLGELDTPAHHAAAHLGEDIHIPVYVEER